MKEALKSTLIVDWKHLIEFNEVLFTALRQEYTRFEPFLIRAIQDAVAETEPDYAKEGLIWKQFHVAFTADKQPKKVRELRADHIAQLNTISGTVTRTSVVRPELIFGTFQCAICNDLFENVPQQFCYTTVSECFKIILF